MIDIYLAGAFSDPDPRVERHRYRIHRRGWDLCRQSGLCVFAPIAFSYHLAQELRIRGDWQTWREQDEPYVRLARNFVILRDCGDWRKSVGTSAERRIACEEGRSIYDVTLEELPGLLAKLKARKREEAA